MHMLFVGSVDLDNPGLNVHDNLTMQTTDTTALLSAKDVWPGFSRMQCQDVIEVLDTPHSSTLSRSHTSSPHFYHLSNITPS